MEFKSPNIIGWVLFSIVIILLIVSWVKEEIDMRKWRKKDFYGRSGFMENKIVNNAREKALLEMYKAIERAAIGVDSSIQLAASAPSIMSMCEACVRLESVGKQDLLEKAYDKIFSANKLTGTPMTQKTEGETGNDGSDSGASVYALGY